LMLHITVVQSDSDADTLIVRAALVAAADGPVKSC
jgi:tellurite resistance protein